MIDRVADGSPKVSPVMHLLALTPTDSLTEGYLPAAARLGLDVMLLTDAPDAHRRAYERCGGNAGNAWPRIDIVPCEVRDFREVIARIAAHNRRPEAVFTNSDHLQVQAALAADWFGLPGKDWRAALRTKNKAHMRRALAESGLEALWSAELSSPGEAESIRPPFPCVVKPREGVAGEDVGLVEDGGRLLRHCREVWARRPGLPLVVEEYLPGPVHTLETLGDGHALHILGSFHEVGVAPPHFVLLRGDLLPETPRPHTEQVVERLRALGVGFGSCHTEFVIQGDRARVIEVNYRSIGDHADLGLADALSIPLFEHILRTHLGRPLPACLGARTARRALRIEAVLAERGGRLKAAPGPVEYERDEVRLVYRPMREVGEERLLHHSDRDQLGIVRATGPDQDRIGRVVAAFRAEHHWELV
ncbi:carboxylate--amine ligase [Streptomyces luteireticuli]|uniref:Carboxylate--amine ligase n=2 Tax=Streptomyces luteireticuli TaxID=173858 RepID=A0ABN0YXR6_9ACTN